MKKSLIAVMLLAAVAGTSGVLIGMAIARMRHRGARGAATPGGARMAPATSGSDARQRDEPEVIRFARDPSPTPPFLVSDLSGHSVSTAELRGRVVLVNFWATWCPPCREEIPDLIALQSKYKDRLQIIGVSVDEDAPASYVKAFADKEGINYPVVMGTEIAKEYGGVPALPTSFVVNTDGRVVQKHVGLLDPAETENEVRALLGLPVSARIETFADTGQIFLKNAERATELPDVDMKGLTAEQKTAVLKRLNSESCTCGCNLTIAQCRINDSSCAISTKLAADIVNQVRAGMRPPPLPAASASSAPIPAGTSAN
ncbi:MAG: TlpA disulfide reductase family protein [Candidatus Acidiferrales bacterium]|jgi:thiol-disulfide isomerase/thioredoxin